MRLVDLKNRMERFIDFQFSIKDINTYSKRIYNIRELSSLMDDLKKLKVLNDSKFKFYDDFSSKYSVYSDTIDIDNATYSSLATSVIALKNSLKEIIEIISKVTVDDDPYQLNIKLSSDIKTLDEYFKFNEIIKKFVELLSKITIKDKAVCDITFRGFEKGSDYILFIINALNSFNVDAVYAGIIEMIGIAKECITVCAAYKGCKYTQALIDLTKSKIKKNENSIAEEDVIKSIIAKEINNSQNELLREINNKHSEKIVEIVIEIIKQKHEIYPSINAPVYIKGNGNNVKIDYKDLNKITNVSPKQLETSKKDNSDNKK